MKRPDASTLGLLILLAVLVPLLVLALVARDFILNAVVIPVEYFIWLGNLGIRALPQAFFWGVLCVLAALVVIFTLLSGGKELPADNRRPSARSTRERVAFWTLQLRLAKGGDYSRLRFADFFSKLILDILSYSGRITPEQYEQAMHTGQLDLPRPVLGFLLIRLTPLYALGPSSFKERLALRWLRLKEFFSRKPRTASVHELDADVLQVVQYLEKELEGDRQHDGH